MARIAIIAHEFDPPTDLPGRYFIAVLIARWRAIGHHVALLRGPRGPAAADLAILHVDTTRLPAAYTACAARYPRALNAAVRDISKRRLSVLRAGHGDGPVIVKTDRNHGGIPERDIMVARWRERGRFLGRLAARIHKRLPAWLSGVIAPRVYPVFARHRDVPLPLRVSPRLLVERHVVERVGDVHRFRFWIFVGDADFHYAQLRRDPLAVTIAGNVTGYEMLGPVPAELRAARARLGFDLGKFDYVMVDGRAVIIDANKTIGVLTIAGGFMSEADITRLAHGIDAFLPAR